MEYKLMQECDIKKVIPLYIEYYNSQGDEWTEETVYRRIYQVVASPDSYCLMLEDGNAIIGFAMGRFEQYYDLVAYDLIEIVIDGKYQNKGIGTAFMQELERQVKEKGAAMVQLDAMNDEFHEHFYRKLGYKNTNSLIPKVKWL